MYRSIPTNKVLVLGDGLLGSEIVRQTGWNYISRKKDGFDITSNKFDFIGYDIIINCIAFTNTYSDDKDSNWDINYKAVANLVDYCNIHNIKLIHISTDHVYVGSVSSASESDVPIHDRNWYGYTKLVADAYVQLKSENHLIIRESHKPYPFPYSSAWNNQLTNGDYTYKIAGIIIKLIDTGAIGVYNVGTKSKTWYGLTKDEFNTTPSVSPPHIPNDITMNLDKLTTWLSKN